MLAEDEATGGDEPELRAVDAWLDVQTKLDAFAEEPNELHLDRFCTAVWRHTTA
jgi:hypothetical protein